MGYLQGREFRRSRLFRHRHRHGAIREEGEGEGEVIRYEGRVLAS